MNSTSPSSNNNLPSRLRETAFRDKEEAICVVVSNFPNITTFSNVPGSLYTFSCRLRDAMASLAAFRWVSNKINMEKFDANFVKIKVSHILPSLVVVGSAENIKHFYEQQNLPPDQLESLTIGSHVLSTHAPNVVKSAMQVASSTTAPLSEVSVLLSQDTHAKDIELKLLAGLAALQLLSQRVVLEIDQVKAEWLEQNFDVVLTKQDDQHYVMQ